MRKTHWTIKAGFIAVAVMFLSLITSLVLKTDVFLHIAICFFALWLIFTIYGIAYRITEKWLLSIPITIVIIAVILLISGVPILPLK